MAKRSRRIRKKKKSVASMVMGMVGFMVLACLSGGLIYYYDVLADRQASLSEKRKEVADDLNQALDAQAAARHEVRQSLQPKIDRLRREIPDLEKQLAGK